MKVVDIKTCAVGEMPQLFVLSEEELSDLRLSIENLLVVGCGPNNITTQQRHELFELCRRRVERGDPVSVASAISGYFSVTRSNYA